MSINLISNNKKIFFHIILHWFLRVHITILHDLFALYIADDPGIGSDPAARRPPDCLSLPERKGAAGSGKVSCQRLPVCLWPGAVAGAG